MGNYATVTHTEFELYPMQNDRVGVDYGSGAGKIVEECSTPEFNFHHGRLFPITKSPQARLSSRKSSLKIAQGVKNL